MVVLVLVAPWGAVGEGISDPSTSLLLFIQAAVQSSSWDVKRPLVMTSCCLILCISSTSPFGTASCKEEGLQRSSGV